MSYLLRFGVVADVQYADNDDRQAWYDTNKTRFYRNSLTQVKKAFTHWNCEENQNQGISFVLQLGDIIDGINAQPREYHDSSLDAIRRTLNEFESNQHIPTFHAVGNHELYNFSRKQLAELFRDSLFKRMKLNSESIGLNGLEALPANPNSDELSLYYKINPIPQLKLISLDCFDISVLGHEPTHEKYIMAAEVLVRHHGRYDFDLWDTDNHLVGANKRFQSSNGAISEEQLKWLEEELQESDAKNQMVIVFGHVGIHPDSSDWNTVIWNYDEVIECFNRHPSVVAYLSGHSHMSGYATANGVHYVSFEAIIETPPQTEAFATISVFDDRLEIKGHGTETNRTLYFRHNTQTCDESTGETIEDLAHEEMATNQTIEVERIPKHFTNSYFLLFLAFVVFGYSHCLTSYLKYEVKSEFCLGSNFDPHIEVNDSAIDTSIILESSPLMPETCSVRLSLSSQVDGLIVSVDSISIINSNKSCDNFIQFGSSPVAKWCQSSDAQTLIFSDSGIDIAFNFPNNNGSHFKLIITPFKKPALNECESNAPYKCVNSSQILCISDGFSCDGIDNCPNGSDENACPTTSNDFYTDFCNKGKAIIVTLTKPSVILHLYANESQNLTETDCVVRIEMSTSSKKGLILGIDDIHIGSNDNETCSDYILIQGSDSDKTKWCRNNKTDISGKEFPRQSHIDIGFHAGKASNSSFTLIVTEFEEPSLFGLCFSNKNLKCSSKAGKQCVSKAYQCDGYRNCPEGDDENDCPSAPTTTTTTTTPSNHTTPPTPPSTTPHTPQPTTTPSPSPKPEPKGGLGGGFIALIVIGVLIVAAIVVFVIFKCLKKRRENNGYSAVNSD
ncbi:unnamed protein product [Oppiella nova]|uniref:Calcineurin-like phosphoesterase domain-containing protein n=1 Tax=Oppiella nova TaxID=334625 RepID=A0A7R9LDC6_9ACAR|nr:unnamed protein product [Oppiella nova]CAG2162439.1 unnamed protein product [Oppiella nova]